MSDYISISTLNDFIFCPYSIYLHNVYMDMDEGMYHATPQIRGKAAHETVDNKRASNRREDILALPVYSEHYRLMGKIDLYKQKEKRLIERKYQLKQIFKGQIYQLWAQMLCLQEMGYEVETLAFYELSTNKMIPISLPTENDLREFEEFLQTFQTFNPAEKYNSLLGIEGSGSKSFFRAFYQDFDWQQRRPRTKCDMLNATLDIGYTILFNFIECYLRMFGFDLYVGVYHRLWFKRKSLVCDIMEPFRPIIDKAVRTAWNRKQFSEKDYTLLKGEWQLQHEKNGDYCKIFWDTRKSPCFVAYGVTAEGAEGRRVS